jgi:hypothetical protein
MSVNQRASIARLNDKLRAQHRGGRVMLTQGVQALGPEFVAAALAAVAAFNGFNADNDPYGEHDCASLTLGAERLIWKIDYYDQSLSAASPDPADPAVTVRVLTLMLAAEY